MEDREEVWGRHLMQEQYRHEVKMADLYNITREEIARLHNTTEEILTKKHSAIQIYVKEALQVGKWR